MLEYWWVVSSWKCSSFRKWLGAKGLKMSARLAPPPTPWNLPAVLPTNTDPHINHHPPFGHFEYLSQIKSKWAQTSYMCCSMYFYHNGSVFLVQICKKTKTSKMTSVMHDDAVPCQSFNWQTRSNASAMHLNQCLLLYACWTNTWVNYMLPRPTL